MKLTKPELQDLCEWARQTNWNGSHFCGETLVFDKFKVVVDRWRYDYKIKIPHSYLFGLIKTYKWVVVSEEQPGPWWDDVRAHLPRLVAETEKIRSDRKAAFENVINERINRLVEGYKAVK